MFICTNKYLLNVRRCVEDISNIQNTVITVYYANVKHVWHMAKSSSLILLRVKKKSILKIQFQSINILAFIKNTYLFFILSKCKWYRFMSTAVMSDGAPVKRSFPSNVFGKAITSRMLFVLHKIESNLSIPVKSNLY